MTVYETSIIINKDVDTVRKAFLDFQSYSQWSKFIEKVESPLQEMVAPQPDQVLSVTLNTGSPLVIKPVVVKNDEACFIWKGKLLMNGLFDGLHQFFFEKIDDGSTKFVQSEVFTGILVAPLLWMVGTQTKQGFESFNEALKKRVESL